MFTPADNRTPWAVVGVQLKPWIVAEYLVASLQSGLVSAVDTRPQHIASRADN